MTYEQPRTFGDLIRLRHGGPHQGRCSFCKRCFLQVRKYSTRHYICEPCIEPRKSELLPAIKRSERIAGNLKPRDPCCQDPRKDPSDGFCINCGHKYRRKP